MAELRGDPAHDSLEVQLTEPVVFLRASPTDEGGWSGALIRGVLTLTIANAVPISSIEVELEGHAATSWEDGEGPGRIQTSDEYTVYSASTVLFTLAPETLTRDDEELLNTRGQPSQNQDTPPGYTSTEGGGVTSIPVLGNDLLSSAGSGSGVDLTAAIDQPQESSPRSLPGVNEEKTTEGSCISTATPRSRRPEHHVPIARDPDRRGSSPSKFSFTTIAHVPDATRKRTRWSPLLPFLCGVSLSGSTSGCDQLPSTAQERSRTPADAQTDSPSCCTTLESDSESREMFQRGVYNYPFDFTLPPNVPITTRTEDGSFTWRLHATVKQNSVGSPSTLFMTADREVEVVYYPFIDDIEETSEIWNDPIQVQRVLDNEFACTLSFPTNAAPMGKMFPVKFEAASLSGLRVYALDVYVYLYEFAKYYDRSGALIRKNMSRTVLCTFGHSQHMPSDAPTSPRPWFMGTFPRLPGAMQGFHASSPTMNSEGGIEGNLKSNVRITHILEVLIRVGRENEGVATAKEDMRDFFIREPFMLLSPLCTAKWTNLPRYANPSSSHNQRSNRISLPFLSRLFRSKKSTPERTEVVSGCGELYERLVSGRESGTGQAPPRYGD